MENFISQAASFGIDVLRYSDMKIGFLIQSSSIGGLAQMVERALSMREVAGSIPASSKTLFNNARGWKTLPLEMEKIMW